MHPYSFPASLIALAAGSALLVIVSRQSIDIRSGFIRAFIRNVFIFNLLFIAGIVFNLLEWYLKTDMSQSLILWLEGTILVIMTVIKFFWLYSFLQMNRRIVDQTLSRRFFRIFIYLSIFFAAVLAITYANISDPFQVMFMRILIVFVETVILASAFGGILNLLLSSRKGDKLHRERGAFLFSGLYLFLFTVILVSLTLSLFIDRSRAAVYLLINSGTMILYNFLPLIWLRKYGGSLRATSV